MTGRPPSDAPGTAGHGAQDDAPSKPVRVLAVDDSRAARAITRRMLTELQFEAEEAPNAVEALQRLRDGLSVDVVLIDWHMPQMSGVELVRALRSEQRFNGLRLVMVTTESALPKVVEAVAAGADEYVMKPFTKEILREKLRLIGFGGE